VTRLENWGDALWSAWMSRAAGELTPRRPVRDSTGAPPGRSTPRVWSGACRPSRRPRRPARVRGGPHCLAEVFVGIRIQERFEIAAPPERVWSYLVDPAQVVRCLPGAELLETAQDGSFVGRVRVKVGPVLAAYKGKARFVELDASARRARLTGEGQEASGAGSARMTMTSVVDALDGGGAAVSVDVDVDVVGKLAQFGRGMIEEVSRQIFRQFADCVRSALSQPALAASAMHVDNPSTTPMAAAGDVAATAASPAGNAGVAAGIPAATSSPPPPLRILPLFFSALRAWFRRVFARAA